MLGRSTRTFLAAVGAASPPPGRHDHTAVVAGGALLVFGGRGAGGAPLNDLWKFTVATQEWVQLPSPPAAEPRFGHSAAVVGHAMLVYGGYLEATADFTTQLWSYDLAAGPAGYHPPRRRHDFRTLILARHVIGCHLIPSVLR